MSLQEQPAAPAALVGSTSTTMRNVVAIALAAVLVSVAAQVVVPLPLTPIPFTLQPLAVLVVGGVLAAARRRWRSISRWGSSGCRSSPRAAPASRASWDRRAATCSPSRWRPR
jgi:membrane protease YdiL (CAAX protease family)